MRIAAIVGMPGTGKSEVAEVFERSGFSRIRFGDITDEEVAKRGLPLNEANEKLVREQLRQEHGMAAYAILNLPKIEKALQKTNVVIDGLYSWEEYLYLKAKFTDSFFVIAVWTSPTTRYHRLTTRKRRPLTVSEAAARDKSEIENVNKGGPIAMADFTITNESTMEDLIKQTKQVVARIK
ncbi:MAG: AAA family ATPase [Dehalococcoidales bacterium]|nr:AAA family ATPase [Dehalococcoidales bacterium]